MGHNVKDLWRRIWYSEPVVFVGSLVSAWVAVVAFDKAMDTWEIPLWLYIFAIPTTAFLTAVTRQQVTPK